MASNYKNTADQTEQDLYDLYNTGRTAADAVNAVKGKSAASKAAGTAAKTGAKEGAKEGAKAVAAGAAKAAGGKVALIVLAVFVVFLIVAYLYTMPNGVWDGIQGYVNINDDGEYEINYWALFKAKIRDIANNAIDRVKSLFGDSESYLDDDDMSSVSESDMRVLKRKINAVKKTLNKRVKEINSAYKDGCRSGNAIDSMFVNYFYSRQSPTTVETKYMENFAHIYYPQGICEVTRITYKLYGGVTAQDATVTVKDNRCVELLELCNVSRSSFIAQGISVADTVKWMGWKESEKTSFDAGGVTLPINKWSGTCMPMYLQIQKGDDYYLALRKASELDGTYDEVYGIPAVDLVCTITATNLTSISIESMHASPEKLVSQTTYAEANGISQSTLKKGYFYTANNGDINAVNTYPFSTYNDYQYYVKNKTKLRKELKTAQQGYDSCQYWYNHYLSLLNDVDYYYRYPAYKMSYTEFISRVSGATGTKWQNYYYNYDYWQGVIAGYQSNINYYQSQMQSYLRTINNIPWYINNDYYFPVYPMNPKNIVKKTYEVYETYSYSFVVPMKFRQGKDIAEILGFVHGKPGEGELVDDADAEAS